MKIQLAHTFDDIISLENLLLAWREFIKGKRTKLDVQRFSLNLFDNILQLHSDLANKTYKHGGYYNFNILDPKPRKISKASVRDRLVHHAIYRNLYPFFNKTFICDSYSCRKGKGTHRAINRFRAMFYKVSANNTKICYVLKCDVKQFFASIDHDKLIGIIREYIPDKDTIWLLEQIIESFSVKGRGTGLPLGNLTSQLFVNIYMNEFDQFVKHKLKEKYYTRYADDFVFISTDSARLIELVPLIREFLEQQLKLSLHPDKVVLKIFSSGVDFLGWIHFPNCRILRTSAKRRMFKRIRENPKIETLQSYLGLLRHGNSYKAQENLLNDYWLFVE